MRTPRSRGFILIMSVYVLLVVSILSLSVSARSLAETMTARQYFWNDSAFSLADASLDATMSNFRRANFNSVASTPMAGGNYWTEVTPLPALGPDIYQVIGHGRRQSLRRDLEAIVNATPISVFQYPLFGDQLVDLRGNVETDSFNSALGAYGVCVSDCTGPNPVYNIGNGGDLGTNATASDADTSGPPTVGFNLNDTSVTVNGQVNFGSGTTDPMDLLLNHSSSNGNLNPSIITASPPATSMSDPLLLPPVVVPAGLTCTDLTILSFETVPLAPGTYCFHDVNMGAPDAYGAIGPAVLNVTGEVTIYISGTLNTSGMSSIGNASNPAYTVFQLASPVGPTITTAQLAGTTQLYGAIYAPDSAVTLHGTVDIYGSVTAYSIRQTGDAQVHYDERLQERDEIIGGYTTDVMFWRDCDPTDGSSCSS